MVLRRSIKYHKCNQLGNQKTEHLNAHACGKSSNLHSINKQKNIMPYLFFQLFYNKMLVAV